MSDSSSIYLSSSITDWELEGTLYIFNPTFLNEDTLFSDEYLQSDESST